MRDDIQSFVIRIWHEAVDSEGNATAWRGSIEQVGSGDRFYFQDLQAAADFIRKQGGIDGGPAGVENRLVCCRVSVPEGAPYPSCVRDKW